MSFFKDQLPYVFILRNYQTIFKEYRSLIICRETFSNSANNVLLDLLNTTILFLGGYDLILKGWFRHQGRKKSMRVVSIGLLILPKKLTVERLRQDMNMV